MPLGFLVKVYYGSNLDLAYYNLLIGVIIEIMLSERKNLCWPENGNITWEISSPFPRERRTEERAYRGTLVLDIDGTLTVPDSAYAIDHHAIEIIAKFIKGGGNLVFCTGATTGRIERTVLNPLYCLIDECGGAEKTNKLFESVFVEPENGSALLLSRGVLVEENELKFRWLRLHERHVPDKEKLRVLLEEQIIPDYRGSYIAGDHPEDRVQREYMVSLKGLSGTLGIKKFIDEEIKPKNPEIDWSKTAIKAARTTLDFVHTEANKAGSLLWLLTEVKGLDGRVLGFGDLGDEFASVVPTINVNKKNPNAFRERRMSAMDLTGRWSLLKENGYTIVGEGADLKVLDRKSGKEIQVLRTGEKREPIFAVQSKNGYLTPTNSQNGHPVEIKPLVVKGNGQAKEIDDAGQGTAYIIERLMESGYFR